MRFSHALLGIGIALLNNGCQITGHKSPEKNGVSSTIHQSVFYVNHSSRSSGVSTRSGSLQPEQQKDVWDRIAMQLEFEVPNDERVKRYRNWYLKHPRHLQIVSQRAQPFLHLITERVEARNIPLEIALLPIVESSFDQFASSHVKAAGLWQFVPDTARRFGLEQNWFYDGRRDVVESTEAALDLLEYLHKKFDGNWLHALAAYNTGESRVFRAIRLNEKKGKPTDFWALKLPKETSSYVPKLIAVADVLKNRDKYGIDFQPIANKKAVQLVKPTVPMNLELAAKYARVSLKEIHKLNPAYSRYTSATNKMPQILLPVESAKLFQLNLAMHSGSKKFTHKVQNGDALIKIAQDYGTTVAALKKANNLTSNNIRIGQHLNIPTDIVRKDDNSMTLARNSNIPFFKANNHKVDHTIVNGDSLWSIAKTYQVSAKDLAAWNDMDLNETLRLGRKLTILTKQPSSLKANSFVYQIQSGDSLSAIASKYNVTVSEITKWNSLDKDSLLRPGQPLTLYTDKA